jgi:predicted nucleic acid-binding protein
MKRLEFRATRVRTVRHVVEYPRDPTDEPYLDLAVAVKADYLVTRDKDLLSLMTSHSIVAKQIRQRTRPLKILNPVHFFGEMRNRA